MAKTTDIVLSHGHYDHTGGVGAALEIAPNARIYLHPASFNPKFARKDDNVRAIGMPDSIREVIYARLNKGNVVLTKKPTEIAESLFVTGQEPRTTIYEGIDSSGTLHRQQCYQEI